MNSEVLSAPIGFVHELLVVANNLTMKEVKVFQGKLEFLPKFNRCRDAIGLSRRLLNRFLMADLALNDEVYHNGSSITVNQDRLEQLIDLRGWPEVSYRDLVISFDTQCDEGIYSVIVTIDCHEKED